MRPVGPSTRCVHGASGRSTTDSDEHGALERPLVLSSAFGFESALQASEAFAGRNDRYIYGRWGNPTVRHLEATIAELEGAEDAVATASGMAAVTGALLANLRAGDHLVAPTTTYGETSRLVRERLPDYGIAVDLIDESTAESYSNALKPATRVLYVETPANPTLAVTDIRAVAAVAQAAKIVAIVDNTVPTPLNQCPLELGATLVVHSMTKALGGHGDAIGGIVAGGRDEVHRVRDLVVKGFGGVLSPFNAFLLTRGLRALALRQDRACSSALEIARYLEGRSEIRRVHYPGLATHPGHGVACRQMRRFGSLLAFEMAGGLDAGRKVLDRIRLVTHAVSLGDVRTLMTHPASTTAASMPPPIRRRAGIADGLLRLSVGIEDAADLIDDLEHALG